MERDQPVSSQTSPRAHKSRWLDVVFVLMIVISLTGLLYNLIQH